MGLPAGGATSVTTIEQGRYRLGIAEDARSIDAALRLRFRVFNVELGEGLESSWATGRDEDPLDAQFDHLIVEDREAEDVVGTYRIQTREIADAGRGFYSADEFELSDIPPEVLDGAVELGRACIDKAHRNRQVLFLLWRGLASYLAVNGKRYLFGCSSLTSQDPSYGLAAFAELRRRGLLHPTLHVRPRPGCLCEAAEIAAAPAVTIPTLFETYLRFGGTICGPPAIDRAFRTIDFLTWLDTEALDPGVRRMFFDEP
jgi:putative hemolysin